jgi:hypothetical protein
VDRKAGALAFFAFNLDGTAQKVDESLRDGEAQAGSGFGIGATASMSAASRAMARCSSV